jgi:hypothetical protein
MMGDGTSSQSLMKIAAKEMATIPTETPAMVFIKGFPLNFLTSSGLLGHN